VAGARYHEAVMRMDPHRLVAERSRALHIAVAERLQAEPRLLDTARARVRQWLDSGTVAAHYAEAWRALLDLPLASLATALAEQSERMHDLRQVSPFAGVLDARTRWRIHREVATRSA
jgi:hypothetical protein